MKTVLTNLSNDLYQNSRILLNNSAKKFGIQEIYSYDFDDLKQTGFYSQNKEILQRPTGLGYWLWKPYIILEVLEKITTGDVIVYADCGIEIIDTLQPLIEISKQHNILAFGNANELNYKWTKRDSFVLMNCDSERYWYGLQCDASFCIFRKSATSIEFVKEWLKYCRNKNILTDLPNIEGLDNIEGFIEHRRDQSVLSILIEKYKIPFFRCASQFGNHYKTHEFRIMGEMNYISQTDRHQLNYYSPVPYYNSSYFQILFHHRTKNEAAITGTKNGHLIKNRINVRGRAVKLLGTILNYFGYKLSKAEK